MSSLKAACVQMTSTDSVAENTEIASKLIREAKAAGAAFIATPEMTSLMDQRAGAMAAKVTTEEDNTALSAFRKLSAAERIWLLVGSMAVKIGPARYANRSFMINPEGEIAATYDKIHMFDVEIGDGQTYKESADYQPGEQSVLVDAAGARMGLSICYDVRFPHLYRAMATAGAEVMCVPAAFTKTTGMAHWHVLLRARAIETNSFVIAPGQVGRHPDGRETFGHSLIISPWGEILAEGSDAPGIVTATLDLDLVHAARQKVPSLRNGRNFAPPRLFQAEPNLKAV